MERQFLPEIAFCETDAGKVEAEVITGYEGYADVDLYPGDPVRLFLEGNAFLTAQNHVLIDFTGKQNLLHYAVGSYLGHLGKFLHTYRLPAAPARATFVATLASVRPDEVIIPQGVRIKGPSGVVFVTEAELLIPAGETSGQVVAVCDKAGEIGNNLLPGQIKSLVDPIAHVKSLVNSTKSAGGVEVEDDERLRWRISLASEAYGSCGSRAAYIYHALSAHPGIMDVAPWQPSPGAVHIAVLMRSGALPGPEVIKAVWDHLNKDEIRPFTDTVNVQAPVAREAVASITYYILVSYAARALEIGAKVEAAVAAYCDWQRAVLGRDILPQKLTEMIQGIEGIQRVEVASPTFLALEEWETAQVTVGGITYGGLANV